MDGADSCRPYAWLLQVFSSLLALRPGDIASVYTFETVILPAGLIGRIGYPMKMLDTNSTFAVASSVVVQRWGRQRYPFSARVCFYTLCYLTNTGICLIWFVVGAFLCPCRRRLIIWHRVSFHRFLVWRLVDMELLMVRVSDVHPPWLVVHVEYFRPVLESSYDSKDIATPSALAAAPRPLSWTGWAWAIRVDVWTIGYTCLT